ncbi:MAG: hypothetical protein EP338_05740 [Bacteroidetes bacterium]|nr:MAG: hypothetical protein EP338_05740 [Bacteroidota bacterium]
MKKGYLNVCLCGIFLFCISVGFKAQDWRLGGNVDFLGANGLLSNNNYLGGTQTASLRLGTANNSRLFIGGTTIANPGFIAIGNNFLNPNSVLHINGQGYGSGEVFRTDGPASTLNAWRMETGGVPRASFYTQANNNVFTEVRTQGAIYGIRTDNQLGTNGGLRLLIMNDGPLQPKGSFC